jgi:TonB family protein
LSSGTAVEVFGTGGEAYANYLQFVKTVYDEAWLVTPDLVNDDAAALVRVTIARSGHVVSSEIIRRSGNSTLDKSVQRALDKVKFVAPFPEKAREAERTFTIEFNLTTKRMAG